MGENALYLALSVTLSAGRNVISKVTAVSSDSRADFYRAQTVLFGTAAVLFALCCLGTSHQITPLLVIYGLIYGVLLVISQWMLVLALKSGETSVCTVIYSLGFILPTVSGALFWEESFTWLQAVGIVAAVCVILLNAKKSKGGDGRKKTFLPFIVTAMFASGGLGIMQKVQQSSPAAADKALFLLIAFVFATACSLIAWLTRREKATGPAKHMLYPMLTGLCFGGANLCNTTLAGLMDSAVFFPLQNISTILASTLLGILLLRERVTGRIVMVLLLGIAVVLLFSIG